MKKLALLVMGLMLGAECASAAGVLGVGRTNEFPKAMEAGAPLSFVLWQWNEGDSSQRVVITTITNDAKYPIGLFGSNLFSVRYTVPVDHDTLFCEILSSDAVMRRSFGPQKVVPYDGDITKREYRAFVEGYYGPPRVGRYSVQARAESNGKTVAERIIHFELVNDRAIPNGTSYLDDKKDCAGNPITCSKPVVFTGLNESSTLKDNDYPFEPQKAYTTINYERFPAFSLPPRFVNIWHCWRFEEEPLMGGPLNRGFNATAVQEEKQDRNTLPINERVWWHTPDHQIGLINQWYAKEPERFQDLKGYADYKSAFVSASNAIHLGYECYGGNLAGVYGWDEEQMWPTIAETLVREHPEYVPADVLALAKDDPKVEKAETKGRLQEAYIKAWGDFVANTYIGAKARAAEEGINLKIWHYGTKPIGNATYHWGNDCKIDEKTGLPANELPGNLWRWFKEGGREDGKVDFNATLYSKTIEYWSKDFYYWTLLPEHVSMYEKGADGNFVLGEHERRVIRRDLFEDTLYQDKVKIGYDDPEVACMFLKKFIAMGEDSLYWCNGGKYYKQHGSLITTKQLMPAVRPGNQETWPGNTVQLGSRPISPYMAEAVPIFSYMMGLEAMYLWDAGYPTGRVGFGHGNDKFSLGQLEFLIKGMHRVSNFNSLFEGTYSYIRPNRVCDTWNRDNALLIRGVLNGRYLALAMSDPYLDPGESIDVDVWYDKPFAERDQAVWKDHVTVQAKKNHLFQCKLPDLPAGYDPDKLYFRYTLKDGNYTKLFTLTGNWTVPYPFAN